MRTQIPRLRFCHFGVLLVACIVVAGQWLSAQQATLVLHNGKIVTVDKNFSMAEAVAVNGNKIVAVGSDADVMKVASPSAQVIDLKGRTVVPGLIDTHRHMYGAAEGDYGGSFTARDRKRYLIDFNGVTTKEDVLSQIKQWMDKYKFPPGEWLYFNAMASLSGLTDEGINNAKILYNDLDRYELDKVTPNNPVLMSLSIPEQNGLLVNSKAIEIIWKDNTDFLKKNGRYWVDKAGKPSGHLESPATRFPLFYSYNRAPEVLGAMYKLNNDESDAMGLLTISTRLPQDSIAAYRWLEQKGQLGIRVSAGQMEAFGTTTNLTKTGMADVAKLMGGDDWVWVSSVSPTSIDGSNSRACTNLKRSGTYTAIDKWYPMGQCYMDKEYRGAAGKAAPISANYYKDWVVSMAQSGIRFSNTHVAGDRSVSLMLTDIEEIQKKYGPDSTKGWALDHCDMVDPADFKRIAKLGVTMSCYVANSVNNSDAIARAYGEQVANTFAGPIKSMLDAGAKVVFETDNDSFIWGEIQTAITRKDKNGKAWSPKERIDRETALKMATSWASEYVLRGDKLGSIESGKLADLVVLDKDYLTVPEDEIGKLAPQLTIVDGKIVFVHTDFSKEYNLKPDGAVVSTYQDLLKRRVKARGVSTGG